MLSLSSYPAAGMRRALAACVHSDSRRAFPATAREASRGRPRTPSNSLKELLNPSLRSVCSTPGFSSGRWRRAVRNVSMLVLRFSRRIREFFRGRPASA